MYKWWKKILFFIIEISILNSKVLFDIIYHNTKTTDLDYKISLFDEILNEINNIEKPVIEKKLFQNNNIIWLYDIIKVTGQKKEAFLL